MRRLLLIAALVAAGSTGARAQCLAARTGSSSDFVAGSSTLFETSFGRDALGEFPRGLELKAGAAEVAEWQGKRALRASQRTVLAVPLPATLPESFTVEVGVVNRASRDVAAHTLQLYGGRELLADANTDATRVAYGPISWEVSGGGASASGEFTSEGAAACAGQEVAVQLLVDGSRLGFYADQSRLASVSNARFQRAAAVVITLEGRDAEANAVYLTRIRVAGGSQVATTSGTTTTSTTTMTVSPTRTETLLSSTTPLTKVLQTERSLTTAAIAASGLFPPLTTARSLTTRQITAAGLFPPLQTSRTITTAPIVAKGQP